MSGRKRVVNSPTARSPVAVTAPISPSIAAVSPGGTVGRMFPPVPAKNKRRIVGIVSFLVAAGIGAAFVISRPGVLVGFVKEAGAMNEEIAVQNLASCTGMWGQCGGSNYTGPGCCSGTICNYVNDGWSNCIADPESTCIPDWGQCGGFEYTGTTCCAVAGTVCTGDDWYKQCIPGVATPAPTPAPTVAPTPTPTSAPTCPAPTPAEVVILQISTRETSCNDGGNAALFLDRHNPICESGFLMQEFKFVKCAGGNFFKIVYTCIKPKSLQLVASETRRSPCGFSGTQQPSPVSNLVNVTPVKIGVNGAVSSFFYTRSGCNHDFPQELKLSVSFQTFVPLTTPVITTRSTQPKTLTTSDSSVAALDGFDVKCEEREVLTGWALVNCGEVDQFCFRYSCVSLF